MPDQAFQAVTAAGHVFVEREGFEQQPPIPTALGEIGESKAVEPLMNALHDSDARVQDWAAKALGVSRPTFKKAVASGIVPGGFQVGRLRLYPRPAIWALLTGQSPALLVGEPK